MKQENDLIYLMGDYNINLLNYGKHNEANDFVDILHASSFVPPPINRPTRVQKESPTLIDNIFTNDHSKLSHTFQGLIFTEITDHFPIIHIDYELNDMCSELMDKWVSSLQRKQFVIGIFLDFSKVFDNVDQAILLQKLCHYGIRDNALKWFTSYLSNRRQYVTYNGVVSAMKVISCGVPQGSILGPLLFLYISMIYAQCANIQHLFYLQMIQTVL